MQRYVVSNLAVFILAQVWSPIAGPGSKSEEKPLALCFDGPLSKDRSLVLPPDEKAFVVVERIQLWELFEDRPYLMIEFYRRDAGPSGKNRFLGIHLKVVATDLDDKTHVLRDSRYGADYVGPPARTGGGTRSLILDNRHLISFQDVTLNRVKRLTIDFSPSGGQHEHGGKDKSPPGGSGLGKKVN